MSQRVDPAAPSDREERKGQQQRVDDPLQLETDTVELEHGAEFSEATLDILRGYERPSYRQELEDSLDPIDDLDDHIAHGIKIPPATYEALQAAGREEIEGLARLRDAPINPAMQQEVRYRQQLAEGSRHEDLNWLKMRAYYRGLERIRAERDAQQAQASIKCTAGHGMPADKAAREMAQQRKQQLAVAAAKLRRAQGSNKGRLGLYSDDVLDSSEESEWPQLQQQQQQQQQLSPELCEALSAQLVAYAAQRAAHEAGSGAHGQPLPSQGSPISQQAEAPGEQDSTGGHQEGAVPGRRLRTVYTEAYLQQQRLSRQVQLQQQQRSLAFWLSLAIVSGTYLVKVFRRKNGKGRGKGKGAAQQPKTLKSAKAAA